MQDPKRLTLPATTHLCSATARGTTLSVFSLRKARQAQTFCAFAYPPTLHRPAARSYTSVNPTALPCIPRGADPVEDVFVQEARQTRRTNIAGSTDVPQQEPHQPRSSLLSAFTELAAGRGDEHHRGHRSRSPRHAEGHLMM